MPGEERVSGSREPAQIRGALGEQIDLGITADLADGRPSVRVGVEVGDPGVAAGVGLARTEHFAGPAGQYFASAVDGGADVGEVEGLGVSLAGADDKLTQLTASLRRTADAVQLGMPAFPASRAGPRLTVRREGRTVTPVTEPLHACADGILAAEAAVGLPGGCGSWLHRDDFTSQFITTAGDADDGAILVAAIGWQAAVTALDHGFLPCSSGERHVLKLAASIAAGTPSASATP